MLARSAGWQPAVSLTGSRPGVRSGWRQRISNPRYSGHTVCATLVAAQAAPGLSAVKMRCARLLAAAVK